MGGIVNSVGKAVGLVPDTSGAQRQIGSFKPTGFSSAGLSGGLVDGKFQLTRGAPVSTLMSNLGGLSGQFNQAIGGFQSQLGGIGKSLTGLGTDLSGLRSRLGEGIGSVAQAAISNLNNRRSQAIGNLRENLAQRRIAGSSFAGDALARAEAEFAKEDAQIRAEAELAQAQALQGVIGQEAQLQAQQQQLVQQQAQLQQAAAQFSADNIVKQLTQFNIEGELAANIANGISSQFNQNNQLISELQASEASATSNLVGDIAGTALGAAMFSDIRLKENIIKVGEKGGINLYIWDWKYPIDQPAFGVIAQEIPHAINNNGVLMVDYGRIW